MSLEAILISKVLLLRIVLNRRAEKNISLRFIQENVCYSTLALGKNWQLSTPLKIKVLAL